MPSDSHVFALLIDGDNGFADCIPEIFEKLRQYGEPLVSKVFHNKTTIDQWERIHAEYAIDPVWVPNNVSGKNSADIALVIEAMVLRYERQEITGFCIVSSDSDYTRLAKYLKSQRKFVLGIGKKQTPKSFHTACSEFFYVDNLADSKALFELPTLQPEPLPVEEIADAELVELLIEACRKFVAESVVVEGDWIPLRDVRKAMVELNPAFQVSSYYLSKLRAFAEKVNEIVSAEPNTIEIIQLTNPESGTIAHCVRLIKQDEIFRFRAAYRHVANERKLKNEDGWVLLSAIGDALKESGIDPLIYRDSRHKQLKKVVERMMEDYPGQIELNTDAAQPSIRIK